jgi:hypothetical protein
MIIIGHKKVLIMLHAPSSVKGEYCVVLQMVNVVCYFFQRLKSNFSLQIYVYCHETEEG